MILDREFLFAFLFFWPSAKYLPGGNAKGLFVFLLFGLVTHPVLGHPSRFSLLCYSALLDRPCGLCTMPTQFLECPNSVVAFFSAAVYRSVGSSSVLPNLLQSVNKDLLTTAQFLRNGAVRLTFKTSADCERVLASGIRYGDAPLRLAPAGTQSRIVYLRDCPSEVPDVVVRQFFTSFGEVHSVTHRAFLSCVMAIVLSASPCPRTSLVSSPLLVSSAGFGTAASPLSTISAKSWATVAVPAPWMVFVDAVISLVITPVLVATRGLLLVLLPRLLQLLLLLPRLLLVSLLPTHLALLSPLLRLMQRCLTRITFHPSLMLNPRLLAWMS